MFIYMLYIYNIYIYNSPIKKNNEWLNKLKIRPNYMLLQETHFSFKDTHMLKVKGWKKVF